MQCSTNIRSLAPEAAEERPPSISRSAPCHGHQLIFNCFIGTILSVELWTLVMPNVDGAAQPEMSTTVMTGIGKMVVFVTDVYSLPVSEANVA